MIGFLRRRLARAFARCQPVRPNQPGRGQTPPMYLERLLRPPDAELSYALLRHAVAPGDDLG
ncbi:hypothetical protein RKE29_01765 [Streptomyces sp. B1866]|uniref:hypothetical protein n=1 Tax=Streptomyces sp. B1866 TaxID=3075431 RepID=UPI00288DB279|nr:hypothetical protein [Streptomyces sp. B1866]MDT3395386.1 hypothetical protein [Streptomyces sp. B1866]